MAATYLTKEGLAKLEKELKELQAQKRQLSKDVGTAREWGDLRENAEYHAAKERLGQVLAKISDLEFKLANVQLVDPSKGEKGIAMLGTRVTVKDLKTGKEEKYILAGPDETDPAAGKISIASPLGRGFLGRKAGEKVTVTLPAGSREYQILAIDLA